MVVIGYVREGFGPDDMAMCAPRPKRLCRLSSVHAATRNRNTRAKGRGQSQRLDSLGAALRVIGLALLTRPNGTLEQRVIYDPSDIFQHCVRDM